eukprot:3057214-Rhodomonas_salina.1
MLVPELLAPCVARRQIRTRALAGSPCCGGGFRLCFHFLLGCCSVVLPVHRRSASSVGNNTLRFRLDSVRSPAEIVHEVTLVNPAQFVATREGAFSLD